MKFSIQAARPSSSGYVTFLPRLLMSLLALAFFAAGIGLFVQHVIILRTWQPIEATIVRSDVIAYRNNKQRNMYRGAVELAYAVNGRQYQTPETFNHASSSESSIRGQMESTYGPGTRHRIFYDPANPYSIRWNVGVNFTFFLLPLAFTGVGLILIGLCFFLWRLPYPPPLACARCGEIGKPDDRFCPRCGDALSPVDRQRQAASLPAGEEEAAGGDGEFHIPEQEAPRDNPTALVLVGAFFAIPGLGCLIGAVYLGWATHTATQIWPAAEATVTKSAVEPHRSLDGTPTYQLAVEFDYQNARHSARAAGQSIYASSSYPWIAKRLERFPVGSRHSIRVNPRNPADIRFDTDSQILNWMPTAGLALLGGIFAAIGLGLLSWGLKRRCKSCRRQLRGGATFCAGCGTVIASA